MPNMTTQTQSTIQATPNTRLSSSEAAGRGLYQRLSKLHHDQLHPVGPIEETLVETIIHNCYQIHHVQQAERDTSTFNHPASLAQLSPLARYRTVLQRSSAHALDQLVKIQRRRLDNEPNVMAAGASASAAGPQPVRPARSAVQQQSTRLPVPRPIDQPDAPPYSASLAATAAAVSSRPAPPTSVQDPTRQPVSPPQTESA